MTLVGAGGIRFVKYSATKRFQKEYRKLDGKLQEIADQKIEDLLSNPFPPGLAFEKLKGYSNPDIYSVHVTGNYKISIECVEIDIEVDGESKKGMMAKLRRIGTHNEIDRLP